MADAMTSSARLPRLGQEKLKTRLPGNRPGLKGSCVLTNRSVRSSLGRCRIDR